MAHKVALEGEEVESDLEEKNVESGTFQRTTLFSGRTVVLLGTLGTPYVKGQANAWASRGQVNDGGPHRWTS